MKFTDLFGKATSRWIKYSEYDAVQHENGDWYIMPTKDAIPSVYDPIVGDRRDGSSGIRPLAL